MKNITIFEGFIIKALGVSVIEVAHVQYMMHSFLVFINNSLWFHSQLQNSLIYSASFMLAIGTDNYRLTILIISDLPFWLLYKIYELLAYKLINYMLNRLVCYLSLCP